MLCTTLYLWKEASMLEHKIVTTLSGVALISLLAWVIVWFFKRNDAAPYAKAS